MQTVTNSTETDQTSKNCSTLSTVNVNTQPSLCYYVHLTHL